MIRKIGFFVAPNVSLLGLDCALDTLRQANRHLGKPFYEWCTIGQDQNFVDTSNGLKLALDHSIDDEIVELDMLFVCAGIDYTHYKNPRVFAWMRRMAERVQAVGGITTGAFLMARAGLLDGYVCTTHWEEADAFHEEFPNIRLSDRIFVIDRNRMTSAGGLVTIDLFLQIIARDCGAGTTLSMASVFQLDRMRGEQDPQFWSLTRGRKGQPKQILVAANIMEQNIETPLPLERIAQETGVSVRHLHRIFLRYLQQSPSDLYREVRLKKARRLLQTTTQSVLEISIACGFSSQSAFSRSYLRQFGVTPSSGRI